MKVKTFFWILRGNSEEADRLYGDRAEEIERYMEKRGMVILKKLSSEMETGETYVLRYVFPFYIRMRERGEILTLEWRTYGIDWIRRYLGRTHGIQTVELADGLVVGVAW